MNKIIKKEEALHLTASYLNDLTEIVIDDFGIWPREFDQHTREALTPDELYELTRKPIGHQPGMALLAFPCTLRELEDLLHFYQYGDLIDDDLAAAYREATPIERKERLKKRSEELKAAGIRGWQKQIAREENLSVSRIKALLIDDNAPKKPPSSKY